MRTAFVFAFAAIVASACTQTGGSAAGPAPTSTAAGKPEPPKTIDAKLAHDAYSYNGLDCTDELSYDFVQGKGTTPEAGAQTVEGPKSVEGETQYTIRRTGGLSTLGDDTVAVREDGVYLVGSSISVPSKPTLLMPAKLEPGTVWDTNIELDSNGNKVRLSAKNKAVAVEKVKVKAGEFDAMLVTQAGELENAGAKGSVSAKTWYAKGLGVVKMSLEIKQADGMIVTSSIELTGRGPKKG